MPAHPRNNRDANGAKKRWSDDDRAKRGGTPGHRGSRPTGDDLAGAERSGARRPDWSPGPRTNPRDRFARPERDDRGRDDRRPSRGDDRQNDRGGQERRPFRADDRQERRPFQADDRRGSRPDQRDDRRPFRSDDRSERRAPQRDDRGGYQGGDRSARPPFRADDRGGYQAAGRDERRGPRPDQRDERGGYRGGQRDDRRPAQGGRDDRGARPPFRADDRGARPPFRSDDRGGRPPFRTNDREERRPFRGNDAGGARDERRPARSDDRDERRPYQGGASGRPSFRDAGRDDRRPQRSDDRRPERSDRPERPSEERPSFRGGSDDRRPPRSDDRRPDRGRDDRRSQQSDDRGRRFGFDDRAARYEAPEDVVLERLDAKVVTAAEIDGATFAGLGLGERITDALQELGAVAPFPIQVATIPVALTGRNVLGRGRTGSGKTIAFGAAMVERLLRNWADSGRSGTGRRTGRAPRALILAPTRELALQIDRTVQPISRAVGLYTTQIVGGVPQARQVGALSKGVDIVIGTPGRIEDLLEQGRLDLSQVEITVLDEADHMAELGFLEPMRRLLARVPAKGQRMLFSATLDSAVAALVEEFLPDPAVHEVADDEGGGTADHRVLVIDPTDKLQVLVDLIGSVDRALVFARTRAFAEQLADELDGAGVRAESLHGDLNQARRTRNLARFSDGQVKALVATDVAARGIHVDAIDLVVHADMAEEYKAYLHRSGRTGRAGASGTVVTLIGARRRRKMTELLDRAGIEAEFVVLQRGDDPAAKIGR